MSQKTKIDAKAKKAIDILCERKGFRLKPSPSFEGPYHYYYEKYEHDVKEIMKEI